MHRTWTTLSLIAALALLAGCPTREDSSRADVDPSTRTVSELPALPAGEADPALPGTVPADQPPMAQPPTPSTAPTRAELTGRWFALYGRAPMSQSIYTYEDGHILDIRADGQALIVIQTDGRESASAGGSWQLTQSTLELALTNPEPSSTSKLNVNTPLAFGRDSEIGLERGGRDREIGLDRTRSTEPPSGSEPVERVMGLTAELDGGFLILTGDNNEIFFYGREDNDHVTSAPQLDRDGWHGHIAPGQTADGTVELTGERMRLEYGVGEGVFNGQFTRGYFVGEVTSTGGGSSGYAALVVDGPDSLNGVITSDPFRDVNTVFDFHRGGH